MALSISPTRAWDFTLGDPAGLTSTLGGSTTLTLNGGTLNGSGHTSTAGAHYTEADPPPAAVETNPFTVVLCATMPSDVPAGAVFCGIRDEVNDRWSVALQAFNDGSNYYAINVNGSVGGRISSQTVSSVTEAVIVAHVASGGAKVWYNGSQVLTGTGATITYDANGYLRFNNIGGATGGVVLKYAALYDAEPSAGDITALGSNAASAYSAIFGSGGSSIAAPAVGSKLFTGLFGGLIR